MSNCNNPLSLCKSTNREKFWLDDFTVLYKNYTVFFPKYEMTRIEQLNALSRLFFYMIIVLLIFNKRDFWLYIPIIGLIVVIVLYFLHKYDIEGKNKDFLRILDIRRGDKLDEINKNKILYRHDAEEKIIDDKDPNYNKDLENIDYTLEAGIIDSNGDIRIGPKYDTSSMQVNYNNESLYTPGELKEYQVNTCRRPTHDNPFMNPSIKEFGNVSPPAACNADDDQIKENIRVNFNHDLFRDVDELWERANSQRQFYTVPNTMIPNNQTEFANWLYKIPEEYVCKSNQTNCLRYEDIRFKR